MLKLSALSLEDFGPFKGQQSIRLSPKDGVTVIYGENMRGKTSLLNAIRFAFFGKVLGRGSKVLSLHKIGNWEQSALGKFGFKVELHFEEDGHLYKLTRSCSPARGIAKPESDDDYVVEYFLEFDGNVLGPGQAESELKRLLPEQIARFFLFDGELLQEYEGLLSSEDDMGRKISEAIEKILGVPILTGARATMLHLKEEAEHSEAVAAQGDQKTREYGNQLAALQAARKTLTADFDRLSGVHETLISDKALLEDALKKRERFAVLLEKKESLERTIADIAARASQREQDLRASMSTAWCTLLGAEISESLSSLRARERELERSIMRGELLRALHADSSSECPACLQTITPEARAKIEASFSAHTIAEQAAETAERAVLLRRLEALEQCRSMANPDAMRFRWDEIEQASIDLAAKRGELDELSKQLETVDEDGLRKTKLDHETVIRDIAAVEQGLVRTRTSLDENRANAEGLQKRLDKISGTNVAAARARRQLFSDLHGLFDEAVAVYREDLRKRVERDATEHFLRLTTEPDYASLRINANYGLTIVHKDGADIPVRSAGAEHVVALSLVAALQNNAPLRGPIVIDSPFGRLDREHTTKIVRALPGMARQVILLVYEEELPPLVARNELKSQLRGEWKLERVGSRHTSLVERSA
jgi:DNA sulfur modification protein DndD